MSNVRLENIRRPIIVFNLLDLGARTNIRTQALAPQVAGLVRQRQDIGRKPAAANKAAMERAVSSIHSFLLDDPGRFVAASQPMGSSVPKRALHAPLCKNFAKRLAHFTAKGKP